MASSTLGPFKREPGFCPDCGSVLPSLGKTGGVECYTCHQKWEVLCEPSVMDGNSPLVRSLMCDDRADPEKNMWTPLESKKFISGIQDKIVYVEDRFKYLAQQLCYSKDIIMQSRGGEEWDGKMSVIQSEITPPQQNIQEAENNNTSKKGSFELTKNDGIKSSQDVHYSSTKLSFSPLNSSNIVLPTSNHSQLDILGDIDGHWMAKQRAEDFSDSVSDTVEYFNTAADGLFTDSGECDLGLLVDGLPTDLDNLQYAEACKAVACMTQTARMSMPNGASDITKTNIKVDIVSCNNNNSLASTSSSLTGQERNVDQTLLNVTNDGSKRDLACYTDKGCFSVIASRSPSPENKKNIESSGQVEESPGNGVSKVNTIRNITCVKFSLKNNEQSNRSGNGNKLGFDTNIEKLSHDADDNDLLELSLCPQSSLNKKNGKDDINGVSKVRRVASRVCEVDNGLKRSKSALNVTSKMARIFNTKDEINAGQKKGKSLLDRTPNIRSMLSPTGNQSVTLNRSKSNISKLARKSSSNDEIGLAKRISKVNMAYTSKVARISDPKCEIEVGKKRSKHNFADSSIMAKKSSSNDEIDIANKRNKLTYADAANMAKKSSPNVEKEVAKKRSNHTFADSSIMANKFSPNGENDVANKRNKLTYADAANMAKKSSPNVEKEVAKKRSKHNLIEISKVPKKFTTNVERGLTIQRSRINIVITPKVSSAHEEIEVTKKKSKSYTTNTSNVARTSSPNDEMEVIKKSSKTNFDISIKRNNSITASANPMQKKTKYSSPYAQLKIINKKVVNTSQEKPKSSNPYSQFNGIKKFSKTTITSKSSVKPKPSTACYRRNISAKKQVANRKVSQLNLPKKGSKSTIDIRLHLKQKPSKLHSPIEISTKESRGSITSKYKKKRAHKKSQHHLKKHKTTSKDNFSDRQSETKLETLVERGESKYSRNNNMHDFFNEISENKCPREKPGKLLEEETMTANIKHIDCFQDNEGTSKVIGKHLSPSFYHNHIHRHRSRAREDMPQDKHIGIENKQSIVKATPLTENISRCTSTIGKNQRIEYKNTMIFLHKHYETPTISSQQKQVMKSPFINMKRKVMPFIIARSTMPSHNINVQIQDVISLIRTKPFKRGMPNISDFLKPIEKTPLTAITSVPLASAHYSLVTMCKPRQDQHQLESESTNISSPSTQLVSISQGHSKFNGWKQGNTMQHIEDSSTPRRHVREQCCRYPLQTESNYQTVLNNYINRPQDVTMREEKDMLMKSGPDDTSIIETDGMRARRLLSEIIGYISGDFQQITQNLETNSLEQVVNEEEMASLRAKVEQNTAIVNETMKILEEGKELQSKYRRLAQAVTQDIMFDSHPSVMPTLREPPLSSRLRSLMLNIKNFRKELALG